MDANGSRRRTAPKKTARAGLARALAAVGLAALAGLPAGGCAGEGGEEAPRAEGGIDGEVAAALVELGREDQEAREGIDARAMADTARMKGLLAGDSARSRRLMELVERHGWPSADEVGPEAVGAAFLVLQHSPFQDFKRRMVPEIEAAVEAGQLPGESYALFVDRLRLADGLPQLYGTQLDVRDGAAWLKPVDDPDSVDVRRERLGMPPLDRYLEAVGEAYGVEVRREAGGGAGGSEGGS